MGRGHLEDPEAYLSIILKCIRKKWGRNIWTGVILQLSESNFDLIYVHIKMNIRIA